MQQAKKTLYFNSILEQVKHHFILNLSYDYIEEFLKTEITYKKVKKAQQFTEILYEDQNKFGLPELKPLLSFSYILQKIEKEQTLDIEEFLQIKNIYKNIQIIQQFTDKHHDNLTNKELITELLETMNDNPQILKAITLVIDDSGNIRDNATPTLLSIRQERRTTEQSIRTTLQQLLQSNSSKLSEHLYTLRNNRYVLPIKAEFKNSFKGILHDQSASGTTIYIEPQSIVNINNKLQQLELTEKQEIFRILNELSQKVYLVKDELTLNIRSIAKYDIYNAKATHAFHNQLTKVEIVEQQLIELYDAKHPLLNKDVTIGNDILLGENYQTLMITGANTGGKSVFLKTVGILMLMVQTGLFLSVNINKHNRIGVFDALYIDIGDEQSLEQNLSTFSGHINNMNYIIKHASQGSLILLDEIGSGTDPIQGSALAIAMIEELYRKHALVIGTTHFNEVKEFIVQTNFAENAAMIFDLNSLTPTYKIRYGSYGASYAFDIATALNLPSDIINNARNHAKIFSNNTQELLSSYEQRLKQLDDLAEDLSNKEVVLEQTELKLNKKINDAEQTIEKERKQILKKAELELQSKLEKVNQLLEELKDKKTLKQNEHADIKGTINQLGATPNQQTQIHIKKSSEPLRESDLVFVQNLQSNGTLLKKQGNKWQVKVGNLSMTLPEKDLTFVKHQFDKKKDVKNIRKNMSAIPAKLDLRGFRVLEGIETLEAYLANASSAHDTVRIIHGHGTGSMRDAVQDVLRRTKMVKNFRYGGEGEGGVGATIVEFK